MPYVFAYFRQIYQSRVETDENGVYSVPLTDEEVADERLHLAVSEDGLHWRPLRGNSPMLPDVWMRDPYVGRGANGDFHLVATANAGPHSLRHLRSRDLITWEPPQDVAVTNAVTGTHNVWAPEFVFDTQAGDYLVYWSSSYGPHGWDDSRIWCARTADFAAFSAPKLMFDPGFTVIDATIVPGDGRYTMFVKDERFGHRHGEHRYIVRAEAQRIDGPYTMAGEAITPTLSEGPAVYQLPDSRWALCVDRCMADDYAVYTSPDLEHWEETPEAHFPKNARHGSVVEVTAREMEALLRTDL